MRNKTSITKCASDPFQTHRAISRGTRCQRRIKLPKLLGQGIRVGFCIVLLGGVLWGVPEGAAADKTTENTRPSLPEAGTQLPASPVSARVSAVVNFEELARQEAAMPEPKGPPVPRVIHPPITPPEADAPAPFIETLPYGVLEPVLPSAPSPNPSASFAGLDDIPKVGLNTIVIPPDTDGAVGLTKVMVDLNNNYRIQDKATGAALGTVSIDTFWAASGGSGFFDPKALYDPINDRWIIIVLSGGGSANSSINIGVSQTSDPSGSYYIFRVDADSTNTNWADFPTIGFNQNWVAVNVNMFTISNNIYANSRMLVVDYAQLRNGTFSGTLITGTGFCSSPAATYSPTEGTLDVPVHLSSASGTYRVDTITGTPGNPVYTIGATKSRGLTWTQPSGDILPQAAPLAGTSACGATPCRLETQDAQIRSTPVVREGSLYQNMPEYPPALLGG